MKILFKLFGKKWLFDDMTKNTDIKNYYSKVVICNNCGLDLPLLIKKGIYVKYVITNVICYNCGCKIDKGV